MKLAIFSGLLAGASAFSVQQLPSHASSLSMAEVAEAVEVAEVAEVAEAVEVAAEETSDDYNCISKEDILSSPNCIEMAVVWDPLKLADAGGDETLAWFRHAEVKHGRVAMAAFVGWWAVASNIHFPGSLSTGLPFASIPTQGLQAWEAVPGIGKVQMLLFAGLIELCDEYFHSTKGTHYVRTGTAADWQSKLTFYRFLYTRFNSNTISFIPPVFKITVIAPWRNPRKGMCSTTNLNHFLTPSSIFQSHPFSINYILHHSYRIWFLVCMIHLDFPRKGLKKIFHEAETLRLRMAVLP